MAGPRREVKRSAGIVPCFLCVELGILGGTAALAYQLEFTDAFPVHEGGFFCRDPAYGRPYPGPPGASRAPPALVYALVTAVPTLTIVVGELAGRLGGARGGRDPTILWGECCYLGAPLRRLLRFLGVFSFGLLATGIFANAGQVVTGAPAPHFLAVCRPNYTALGCAPPRCPPRFVPPGGAPCAGDPPLVAAARRAFPCKEAALGAYGGAYAALYVTLAWRGGGLSAGQAGGGAGAGGPPLPAGGRARGRAPQPLGRCPGRLRHRHRHRRLPGDLRGGQLPVQGGAAGGGAPGGEPPQSPPEVPRPQPPLEELSVTQARRAEFPAVT